MGHVIIINNSLTNFDPSTTDGQDNRSKCSSAQLAEIDRLRSVDPSTYAYTVQDKAFVIGLLNQVVFSD